MVAKWLFRKFGLAIAIIIMLPITYFLYTIFGLLGGGMALAAFYAGWRIHKKYKRYNQANTGFDNEQEDDGF